MAKGIYLTKSEANTQYSLIAFDAISLAIPCIYTAQHADDSKDIPCAQKPAIIPVKTSPVPAFDNAELPV